MAESITSEQVNWGKGDSFAGRSRTPALAWPQGRAPAKLIRTRVLASKLWLPLFWRGACACPEPQSPSDSPGAPERTSWGRSGVSGHAPQKPEDRGGAAGWGRAPGPTQLLPQPAWSHWFAVVPLEKGFWGLKKSPKPLLFWEVRVLRRLGFHSLLCPNCCVMLGNFFHSLGLELPLNSGGTDWSRGSDPWPCTRSPGVPLPQFHFSDQKLWGRPRC